MRIQVLYFFVCLHLLVCLPMHAQWVQTNGLGGGYVRHIAVDGGNVFAGTEHGLYLSVDSGATWIPVTTGLPADAAPTNLVTVGPDVFVGFMEEGLFHSSDHGMTWTEAGTTLPSKHVIALAASSDTSGGMRIAASTEQDDNLKGQIFVSTNLGHEWTEVYSDSSWLHHGVLALSGNSLFIGKGWGGGLLRVSWTETDRRVDTLLKWVSVNSLAISEDTLFAGTSDGLYLFECGDTARVHRGSPPGSDGYIYTVGINGPMLFVNLGLEGVYRSADHGVNWSSASSGLDPDGWPYINSFAFLGTTLLAASWDGVFRSNDNGDHWFPSNVGINCTGINAIAVMPAQGRQNELLASTGRDVYRSSDEGMTWNCLRRFDKYFVLSLYVLPSIEGRPTTILAGGTGIHLSTDHGETWTSKGLDHTRILCFAAGGSSVFAGTDDNGVFRSTNDGETWTPANRGMENADVEALAMLGSSLVAGVVHTSSDSNYSSVYFSSDDGEHWEPAVTNLPSDSFGNCFVREIAVIGSDLFVATQNGIFLTTNNGADWTRVSSGLKDPDVWTLARNGMDLFASGPGGVYRSSDHGATWIPMNSGFPPDVNVSAFAFTENNIFAGTLSNSVWRRPLAEMTTATAPGRCSSPDRYFLYQNYPNPFNPLTIIQYSIGATGGLGPGAIRTRLVVYDLLGREVKTLVDEQKTPGSYEVSFDGSQLSSGVYIYRVTAGQFAETKKMILAK